MERESGMGRGSQVLICTSPSHRGLSAGTDLFRQHSLLARSVGQESDYPAYYPGSATHLPQEIGQITQWSALPFLYLRNRDNNTIYARAPGGPLSTCV